MKVLSVTGTTGSGKTTTVENIIRELKKRGHSVGSVKEIHYEQFTMDKEGSNTVRHKKAGAELVTARGFYETDVLFPSKLPIDKILSLYNQDYVILEGVDDINAPVIIAAHNTDEIDERIDYRTLAVTGVITNEIHDYKDLSLLSGITEIKKLVDLIEEKVPELLPDFDPECCTECGYDCHTMLHSILKGSLKRDDCVINDENVKITVDGRELDTVPFVKKILKNTLTGIVKELDGYKKDSKITVTIGR